MQVWRTTWYVLPIDVPTGLLTLHRNLALMRDHTKLLALGRNMPPVTKAQIQVYSPAGEGLLLFSVDDFSVIVFVYQF